MDLSTILYRVWAAYSTGWGLWVSGGMYLWFALCLMIIARKSHVPGWWAGWVPVVNFWIVCAAGKASSACFWRLAVSLVAIVAGIVLWIPLWIIIWLVLWAVAWAAAWGRVSHERGHSAALGLLSPVPVLSLVLFGLLAFDE